MQECVSIPNNSFSVNVDIFKTVQFLKNFVTLLYIHQLHVITRHTSCVSVYVAGRWIIYKLSVKKT